MTICKNVRVFVNGSLQTVDLDENGRIVGNEKQDKKPTKQDLMKELKERGIKFKATLSSEKLQELLDNGGNVSKEDGDEKEPASGGTGNQDVI